MINPSKLLPANERTLVEAWHGPNSTAAIAADLGIKGSDLDLAFRQLKARASCRSSHAKEHEGHIAASRQAIGQPPTRMAQPDCSKP